MWTPEHRRAADRCGLRYPSDLTDAEWVLVGADDPAGQARRAAARGEHPRGCERDLLCTFDRLPMGGAALGSRAAHGAGQKSASALNSTLAAKLLFNRLNVRVA